MVNSRNTLLLSLFLLIGLSGCSGNRLREMFAPDREFMALSEIEEPADVTTPKTGPRQKLKGLVASRPKKNPETVEEEDRIVQTGFLKRLLKSRENEDLPEDPFLNPPDSKERLPVIAAAKSQHVDEKKKPTSDREEKRAGSSKNRQADSTSIAKKSEARPVRPTSGAKSDKGDTSLADLIEDFRNDEKLFPPSHKSESSSDGFDNQQKKTSAKAIQTVSSKKADEGLDEFLDFVSLETDPSEKKKSSESEAEQFDLDVALLDELTASDSVENDDDAGLALPEGVDDEDDADKIATALIQDAKPSAGKPSSKGVDPANSADRQDIAGKGTAASRQTMPAGGLTVPGENGFGWEAQQITADASAFDDESLWSTFPEIPVSRSSSTRDQYDGAYSMANHSRTDNRRNRMPIQSASHTSSSPNRAEGTFESDPFLADFESQAGTPAALEATSPAAPVQSGTGPGGIAPRIWLVLLAGVVVLYLLLAPDRRNPPYPTNR